MAKTNLFAMKLPVICRTCDSTDTDNLLKLATPSKKYPDKLLSEILCELTEINVNKVLRSEIYEKCKLK